LFLILKEPDSLRYLFRFVNVILGTAPVYLRTHNKQEEHWHAIEKILKVHYPAIRKRHPQRVYSREKERHDLYQRRGELRTTETHRWYGKTSEENGKLVTASIKKSSFCVFAFNSLEESFALFSYLLGRSNRVGAIQLIVWSYQPRTEGHSSENQQLTALITSINGSNTFVFSRPSWMP